MRGWCVARVVRKHEEEASVLTDPPQMARYTCGFRTTMEPVFIRAHALGRLADMKWTLGMPPSSTFRLSGRQADRLQLEIVCELPDTAKDGKYSYDLSIAAPDPAEGAAAFFTWRAKVFEAFRGELVVTSVEEEIRATHDAQRDILELDGQDLTGLPREIGLLHRNLKVLSLSNNRLSKLPDELVLLEQLTELDVSDNLLTELPAQIGRLTSLETLSVEHNRLRELPPSIGQLSSLRELRANDNKLRRLPAEIGRLTKLRRLFIQQNRLTELPREFTRLDSLWEWEVRPNRLPPSGRDGLKAAQNPWVHPPEEIVRKGPKAIREFLAVHPQKVAAEGATAVYTVYVDDNHHRFEEQWKRRALGSFADCATAIATCRKVVDDFFANFPAAPIKGLRGEDAADLVAVYRRYGEDPWICSEDAGCVFDAWSYAEQRCAEIAQWTREHPPAAYTVYARRNKDGTGMYKVGEFADCEPAIAACRKIVDDFLVQHNSGTAEEMFATYRSLGEYAAVATRDETCVFWPWKYAEQRCHEMVAEREG
jgi:hypothetical protein